MAYTKHGVFIVGSDTAEAPPSEYTACDGLDSCQDCIDDVLKHIEESNGSGSS